MKHSLLIFIGVLLVSVVKGQISNETFPTNTEGQIKKHVMGLNDPDDAKLHFWALSIILENGDTHIQERLLDELSYVTSFNNYHIILREYLYNGSNKNLINYYLEEDFDFDFYIYQLSTISKDRLNKYHEYYIQNHPNVHLSGNEGDLVDTILNSGILTNQQLPFLKNSFNALSLSLGYLENKFELSKPLLDSLSDRYSEKLASPSFSDDISDLVMRVAIFQIYYNHSNYSFALKALEKTQLKSQIPASPFLINLTNRIRYAFFVEGRYDKAASIYQQYLLPISNNLMDSSTYAYHLLGYGNVLFRMGKMNTSLHVYENLYKGDYTLSSKDSLLLLNNLATVYYKTGRSAKYQKLQLDAIALSNESGSHKYLLYKNLYHFHIRRSNSKKALAYLDKAREIVPQQNDVEPLIQMFITYAFHERYYNENPRKALDYIQKADSLLSDVPDYKLTAKVVHAKAQIYELMGQLETSIAFFEQALNNADKKNDLGRYYQKLVELARLHLMSGEEDEAAEYMEEIAGADKSLFSFELLIKTDYVKAQLMALNGKIEKAVPLLRENIEQVVERARLSADFKSGYWHVEPVYLDLFEYAANLLLKQNKKGPLVEILDQFKTINDAALYRNSAARSLSLTPSELVRDKKITERLERYRLAYLTSTGDKRFKIEQQIEQMAAEKRVLDQKLNSYWIDTKNHTIKDFKELITEDELVLHYTKINKSFYITSISRDSIAIQRKAYRDEEKELIDQNITALNEKSPDLFKLYRLYEYLEIDTYTNKKYSKVTFLPDAELNAIPMDILPTEKPSHSFSYGGTRYLIEDYEVRNLTSLQDLQLHNRKKNSDKKYDFLGFGIKNVSSDDEQFAVLPHAKKEVQNIQQNLDRLNQSLVFTGQQATEKTFRRYAAEARIIHLATHSTVSRANPLFSSIYLTSDSLQSVTYGDLNDHTNDARIFAYELYNLNLENDLIFFNSCSSGSGNYLTGSGVMGMNRALRHAGVKSSILNLWAVNDKLSSEVAEKFYRNVDNGDSLSEALRKTKIFMLNNESTNPYVWGAYTIYGDVQPIDRTYFSALQNQWAFVLLATIISLGLIALAIFGFEKRKKIEKSRRTVDRLQSSVEW